MNVCWKLNSNKIFENVCSKFIILILEFYYLTNY